MRGSIVTILFVMFTAVPAGAETFTVPLQVSGYYEEGDSMPFEFDLGVSLCWITRVRFVCQGTITAGLSCDWQPFSWEFQARLYAEPGYQVASGPQAGAATYPLPEPFAGESAFRRLLGGTWDFLLDGQAAGYVVLPVVIYAPEWPPRELPRGYLEAASIIIEAELFPAAGDLEPDGDIDLGDLAILALAWECRLGDECWDPVCDVSEPKDGVIDYKDVAVLARNWLGQCRP